MQPGQQAQLDCCQPSHLTAAASQTGPVRHSTLLMDALKRLQSDQESSLDEAMLSKRPCPHLNLWIFLGPIATHLERYLAACGRRHKHHNRLCLLDVDMT